MAHVYAHQGGLELSATFHLARMIAPVMVNALLMTMMPENIVFVTKVIKVMTAAKMLKDALLKMAKNAVVMASVF